RLRAVDGPDAKPSETRWRVVARTAAAWMLAVDPQTGRTHQIRVHASHAGLPLLGDRDYAGPAPRTRAGGGVVAFERAAPPAARVVVPGGHGDARVAEAPIPPELLAAWSALGGSPEPWNTALRCEIHDPHE